MLTFDRQSVRRISQTVRTVENWPIHQIPDRRRPRRGPVTVPQLAIASEDIEHGDFGNARFGTGTAFDSNIAPIGDEISVFNPGMKVWSGSQIAIEHWALNGADGPAWVIRHAFSATRIRGRSTSDIEPGESGTLDNIDPIDGHFAPDTASVYLPTELIAVQNARVVWAELSYRESTGTSRWEVYSADCT